MNSVRAFIQNLIDNPQAKQRFETCIQCPSFIPTINQCKECGCFMKAKVFLPFAECPLKKW